MDVVAVFSGCGKINAAITAQQLIDKYEADAIIFSGIAGGIPDSHLCIIAGDAALQADWEIHFGLASIGDIFTGNISPDAVCIDMETAVAAYQSYRFAEAMLALMIPQGSSQSVG